MSWEQVPDEFTIDDIGARLLANLARGIYSPDAVLREYVQNACDAYNELQVFPDQPVVNIRVIDSDSISVQDYGAGMNEKQIKDCKKIAVSTKSAFDGDMTGFRGIGIWAGFQACDRLVIETTTAGVPVRYRLTIQFADILQHVDEDINIKQLLDNRFTVEAGEAAREEHYSRARLIGLHGHYQHLAREDELRRIVGQHLPCRIDPKFEYAESVTNYLHTVEGYREFPIRVNDEEVFKCFPSGLKEPEFEILESNGEEYARCWHCSGAQALPTQGLEYRSFRLRIRNFAVGAAGIYDDEDGSGFGLVNKLTLSSRAHLRWHVGEIHVTNSDIRPDTPRSGLELDQRARRAIEAIRGFYEDRIADSRALSQFNTRNRELEEAEKCLNDDAIWSAEDVRGCLEKLKAQEKLRRGRMPVDKVKKRLRQLLSATENKLRRQRLIGQLSAIIGEEPSGPVPSPENSAQGNRVDSSRRSSPQAADADRGGQDERKSQPLDGEQLYSDTTAVVEEKFPDGDELALELCEAIHGVFVGHGVMNAQE